MENAGREVARTIASHLDISKKKIAIFCGIGGNGGDGFVAARHLSEAGASVEVFLVGNPHRISAEHTRTNWDILQNMISIPIHIFSTESDVKRIDIKQFDILVDGLLGFGLTSKVREPIATAIKVVNKAPGIKYSIDIPSGLDSDTGKILGTAVRADHTITMHAPKPGLLKNPEVVGTLHVVAIGIPEDAYHICGKGDLWLFNRPRPKTAHKGEFGRILIVGGSDTYSGAPALAGMAALRTGADLVTVIAPESVASSIRSYSPNLMVKVVDSPNLDRSCLDIVLDEALRNDIIALGPGMGTASDTQTFFKELAESLASLGKPLVIDADGLRALAETGQVFEPNKAILTPHWGEMKALLKKKIKTTFSLDERLDYAKETALRYGAVVLLKGPVDVVAAPDGRYKFNHTGDPAMTVGGTGDVLTGITAALFAHKHDAFYTASAAAFISGLAGERAADELGGRIVATDCIEKIPKVMA